MGTQLHFNLHTSSGPSQPNLDFILSIPRSYSFLATHGNQENKCPLPSATLAEKLRTVPAASLDKLHPLTTDVEPHVEYIEQGLWKNRITFQKDVSFSSFLFKQKAETQVQSGQTHQTLDVLCEAELTRRTSGYRVIQGITASLKNKFPTLARITMGSERFYKELTQKEVDKYKKQIAYSAIDRDDLISMPKIEDSELRNSLKIKDDTILQTEHCFSKNSPMNGQSFILDGRTVKLSQAIACSNDRKVANTGNLRVVQTKNRESLSYTGRADSDQKALEQASFIFLNEMKTKGKGITQSKDENGQTVYQLDYAVNSMLSAPWMWSAESPIAPFPEREYLENEQAAFEKLKQKGFITIEDPNRPGQTYRVKFNPILFSRSLNLFSRLENWLPPFLTGQSRAQEISRSGIESLQPIIDSKLAELKQKSTLATSLQQKKQLDQQIKGIQTSLQALIRNDAENHLRPEEELLIRDYLCKLLQIPFVDHCKSSTDRTSVAIAISSALQQWIELDLPIPDDLCELINDWRFKELFAMNWMAGHQITRYARGGEGTVAGEKLNNHNLGLALSRGISQNPAVAHLLPERYLKDFPASKKIKTVALYTLLILPLTILLYIPLILATTVRHAAWAATLGKNRHWIGPMRFALPVLPFTLLFNFSKIFPEKILNEDSPQIGARRLIAGGKHGGKEDNEA